jgi:hypothetical protein
VAAAKTARRALSLLAFFALAILLDAKLPAARAQANGFPPLKALHVRIPHSLNFCAYFVELKRNSF